MDLQEKEIKNTLQSIDDTLKRIEEILFSKTADYDSFMKTAADSLENAAKNF